MGWKNLSLEEKNRLHRLRLMGVINMEKEARRLRIKTDSLRRSMDRYRQELQGAYVANAHKAHFTDENLATFEDYGVLEGEDVIIISDLEIPDVDTKVLAIAMLLGMNNNIKRLIIAGDAVATDQEALNSWKTTWASDGDMSYERTLNWTRRILRQFLEWFDEIFIIEGNHDDRIARVTQGQVHLGMMLNDIPGLTYSRYQYMYFVTSRMSYYICHPTNFSKHPVTVAKAIYNTHHYKGKKHSVIMGHTHNAESGWSEDGLCPVHSLGCCRQKNKTRYKSKSANKYGEWIQGIGMIRDGYFWNLPIDGTDWKHFLGEMTPEYLLIP